MNVPRLAMLLPMLMVLLMLMVGCRAAGPDHSSLSPAEVQQRLAQRAGAVQRFSAQCQIRLVGRDGESVQLDGAMAAEFPDHFRLRAWKFGRGVFDLTVTPKGLFLQASDDLPDDARDMIENLSGSRFNLAQQAFVGNFFTRSDLVVEQPDQHTLHFVGRLAEGGQLRAVVTRRDLRVRRYEMLDADGQVRATLTLQRYRRFGGEPWPTQLRASSDAGSLQLWLSEIEHNGEPNMNAFVPPKGATRLP